MRVHVLACSLILCASTALARPPRFVPPDTPGALCQAAIRAVEPGAHVAAGLLFAVGVVESGRRDAASGAVAPWPWTINAEGVGSFYDNKDAAIAAVGALRARGVQSIDVGCMQVNLLHHPDAFASLEQAFDPRANVAYAARFLTALYARTGTWTAAAAGYHSLTPEIGEPYGRKVAAAMGLPLPAALPPPDPTRRNLLAAWAATMGGTAQPTTTWMRCGAAGACTPVQSPAELAPPALARHGGMARSYGAAFRTDNRGHALGAGAPLSRWSGAGR